MPHAKRKTKRLRVIQKPDEKTISVLRKVGTDRVLVSGTTDLDYLCGGCGTVLLRGAAPGQVGGVVAQCGTCNAYNVVP